MRPSITVLKNLLSNCFNSNLVDLTAEIFLKEESLLELYCELQVEIYIKKNAFFMRRNITIILEAHFTTDLTLQMSTHMNLQTQLSFIIFLK